MKWALHNLECFDIFAKNRVFLIGDAVCLNSNQTRNLFWLVMQGPRNGPSPGSRCWHRYRCEWIFHAYSVWRDLILVFIYQDSYILAALLTNSSIHTSPSEKDIENIVDVYNSIRVPRGTGMLKASIEQGHLYYFAGKEFDDYKEGDEVLWDLVYKTGIGINENWTWTADDPKIERRKAESLLEKRQTSRALL